MIGFTRGFYPLMDARNMEGRDARGDRSSFVVAGSSEVNTLMLHGICIKVHLRCRFN